MDLLLSLALASSPLAPADSLPVGTDNVLDLELAQVVLMAEHRLSMPILIRTDSQDFHVTPVNSELR